MSRLKKIALDQSYLNEAPDIQVDMVIFPYLEQVAQTVAAEINFPYSDAVIDEIYKKIITEYSLTTQSTLIDIQNTIQACAEEWKNEMAQQQTDPSQSVASRRG